MAGFSMAGILSNIYLWMGSSFALLGLLILSWVFMIVVFNNTHAFIEFKAWLKKRPIALYFTDHRYADWQLADVEAGVITSKEYGTHIINEKGAYVDKKTRVTLIPCHADVAVSMNVPAAKLADDLQHVIKDERQMWSLRNAIANNLVDENDSLQTIRTSINFSAIKYMLTAMIPHNISAKVQKMVLRELKTMQTVNPWNVVLIFVAVLGAIIVGIFIVKKVM